MIHLCLVTHFAIDEVPEVHMPFQKTPSYASDLKYLHKKSIINKKLMEVGR